MNLLLLLLAMCSALTGVGVAVRTPAAPAVATISVAQQSAAVVRVADLRPPQTPPPLVDVAARAEGAAFVLLPATPLFASRRRE